MPVCTQSEHGAHSKALAMNLVLDIDFGVWLCVHVYVYVLIS